MALPSERAHVNLQSRGLYAFGAVFTVFFVILLRLWYLQIIKGEYFRERSENNRIRTVYVPPPRGLITDRDGKVLVRNRPSFNIELIVEDSPNPKQTIEQLAKVTGQSFEELWQRVAGQTKRYRFEPKLILKDISRDVVAKIAAKRYMLPGIVLNVVPARQYLYGTLGAHVLGYIREITNSQLEKPYYSGYMLGDMVGQYGLESQWERDLQGKRGVHSVIVDATGTRMGMASSEGAMVGNSISLTIDLEVQMAAEKALGDKKGAVVAMDPSTGEILAMTSHPPFDPNMFAGEVSAEQWEDLTRGKEKRLNNRAMQGTFPPGSVFKVFMAVAGLSEGVVNESTRVSCPGYLAFAGRDYRCHKKSGHGPVALYEALVQSCDVYFYTLGQRLGVDRIHEYARKFGLGQRTGLELVEENPGLVPSTLWKKAYFRDPANQKWYPGETLSVAIGQGAVTLTPLQITRGLAAMVNGGHLYKPYLVKTVQSVDGTFSDPVGAPQETETVDVDHKILQKVGDAMVGVVSDPHGTGKRASLEKEFGVQAAEGFAKGIEQAPK